MFFYSPVNDMKPVITEGISKNVYVNPQAPFHLIIGNAGAWIHETWMEPQPGWSAHRELYYGFGRLDLVNSTHLHFQMVRHNMHEIGDEVWIVKRN